MITVRAARDCFKEFSVSNQEVLDWTVSKPSFEPSKTFKCSFLCKMDNIGVMDSNKLNQEKLKTFLNKKPKLYEKCSNFKGDDCDVAFQTFNCLFETETKSSG